MKKVLVLGASRYNVASIMSLRNAGFYVIGVDKNPQAAGFCACDAAEPVDITDAEGIIRIAKKHRADGIIPTNDFAVPAASAASSFLGLPGISSEAARACTMKEDMRRIWIQKGVPCPRVVIASEKEEFYQAVREIGFPCIFKPAQGLGGGSRGVIVVNREEDVEEAIAFSQGFYANTRTLVESFIDAEYEHSSEVLIYNGVPHVLAVSDKVKSPLPYRVDNDVTYPTRLCGERLVRLKQTICDAVTALDLSEGVAHVEIATTKEGFVLFELGARCGGGGTPAPIVPYVTGVDEFVEVARILTGQQPQHMEPLYERACNYHFIVLPPGKIRSISGLEEIRSQPDVLDCALFVHDGEQIKPTATGLDRSGFIIVGGTSPEQVLARSRELEHLLKVEYED